MNFSKRPFFSIIIMVFGGLALFFFGLYQREVEKDLLPSGTEVVGQIVQSEKDVARRANARLLWAQVGSDAMLYKKDTIRTGPGSRVVVRLNNNSSVALGENTLVVLETENESFSLKLADGDVEFSGNVTVAIDGKTKLRSVDGTLRLKRDSTTGKDKVAAVSGTAEVMSDGGISVVQQGEVLVKGQEGAFKMSKESVDAAGLKELGLKEALQKETALTQSKLSALNPKAAVIKGEGDRSLLKLSWDAPAEASKYVVKLGNKEVSVMEPKLEIVPQDFLLHLGDKITVKAIGSGGEGVEQTITIEKPTKEFVAQLGSTPQNKIPFDGSRVLALKRKVTLFWSDSALKHQDFMHYNVMVKTPAGKTKEFRAKAASQDFEFDDEGGVYSWSVQTQFKNDSLGPKSAPTRFEVVSGASLSAPVINPASEDESR